MSKTSIPDSRVIEKIHFKDHIKSRKVKLPKIILFFQFTFRNFGNIFPSFLSKKAIDIFLTPFDKPKHIDPENLFSDAIEKDINVDNLTIKTYTWGSGEKTVLLVHGWESRSCYMISFIPQLLEKGYRVVTFDGPAHGLSDGKMTNMVAFGKVTQYILANDASIDSIIGHSFGGPSTIYALAHAKTKVKKMVIIGSPNDISKVLHRFCLFFHIPDKMEKRMVIHIEKMLGDKIITSNMNYNIPNTDLESILLIHDELDDIVPYQDAIDVFESNKNTSLILSKGLGHSKIKYNLEIIDRTVRFLT